MYYEQTRTSRAVQTFNGLATGRILVVDDDKAFGCFMLAALETRGHEVDWAGSIQDGLASMYAARYDLVIIDLHLPDGSGIDMLRDATDDGLLADSAAIILTGHEFDEPDDIRVFHKPLELDPFLDQMGKVVAHAQTRRRQSGRRGPAASRGTANDSRRSLPPRAPKIELVLYTSPASEKCRKAMRTVNNVLEQYDVAQVNFSVCDISRNSTKADEDAVVFTPTLVKRGPGPRTWIIGNLDQPDLLVDLLDVSGVERKRD
jgi:CheY-like chemotaxis protein